MNVRKALSGLLLGAGCACAFTGALGLIFPHIRNAQFQLVLASFETPSRHWLVNLMNGCMRFVMRNGWIVLLAGLASALAGGWMLWRMLREPAPMHEAYRRPVTPSQGFGSPQPQPAMNPFAGEASAEPLFAPKRQAEPVLDAAASPFAHTPILEPNRIEDAAPDATQASAYARPADAPVQTQPLQKPVSSADDSKADLAPPEPLKPVRPKPAEAVPLSPAAKPSAAPMMSPPSLAPKAAASEPSVSSRIRSTMGKHGE